MSIKFHFLFKQNAMRATGIKTILFPTDFSHSSIVCLKGAVALAKISNSKLVVLNVVDIPFNFNIENEAVEIDLILSDLISFSKIKLGILAKQIKESTGMKIEPITYTGETTPSITRAVVNHNADLIVMGAKVTKDIFFNSTTFNIVKNTVIPLLSIPPKTEVYTYKTILFPFNEYFMTIKKADEVIQFANYFNSKVILLGITTDATLENRQAITNNLMSVKAMFDQHKIECEVHFTSNTNYTKAILDYCNSNIVDLVTIANNLPTSLHENIANLPAKEIINQSTIPVLTVPLTNYN
jgi:nucleotide-binding universal stress UspA family protein